MNYDLVKQLKDAGFPQEQIFGRQVFDVFGKLGILPLSFRVNDSTLEDDFICIPTLMELIEACGIRFRGLEYHPGDTVSGEWLSWGTWYKTLSPDEEAIRYNFYAGTAEEAVANLWLVISKKI